MRKFLIVALALVFVLGLSGLAMADENEALQAVHGYDNVTLIEQVGSDNVARQYQRGDANIAVIWQDGDSNTADFDCGQIQEDVDWWEVDDFNYLLCCEFDGYFPYYMQVQYGNWNEAYVEVDGNNNNTCQWQGGPEEWWTTGDHNYAEISIVGEENNAKQVQVGDENYACIDVSGDGNTVCQYQEGYDNSASTIIVGNSNSACVIQTGG